MKSLIARWYASGRWTADQVHGAVGKGWITADDAADILG